MARILVVDDDPVVQRLLEVVLRKDGHTVVIAENGYAALEKLGREYFQLVISDANMPGGLTGFALVSTIKKNKTLRHIPVLFLTGRNQKEDVVKARSSGVSDYLIKPVNHPLLLQKVSSILNSAKESKTVAPGDISAGGAVDLNLRIIDLSETDVELFSPVPLPVNFSLKIVSPLFEAIGLAWPHLKVQSCAAFKEGDEAFRVVANFTALSESEQTLLRDWLSGASKTGGSEAA